MKSVIILVSLFYFFQVKYIQCVQINYYWRDYTGAVPEDAVPGGKDLNNATTYIGQVFVKKRGIIPGVIYPGRNELVVPSHGTAKVDTYIKILCSPNPSAFHWEYATEKDFHTKMINKFPVKGGFEDGYILNIGRIAYQGETITGKIVTMSHDYKETAPMFFVHKEKEKQIYSYEVLVYDNAVTTIDVRAQIDDE